MATPPSNLPLSAQIDHVPNVPHRQQRQDLARIALAHGASSQRRLHALNVIVTDLAHNIRSVAAEAHLAAVAAHGASSLDDRVHHYLTYEDDLHALDRLTGALRTFAAGVETLGDHLQSAVFDGLDAGIADGPMLDPNRELPS